MAFRTSNPVLSDSIWERLDQVAPASQTRQDVMTVGGTINRTMALVGFLLLGAGWTWYLFYNGGRNGLLPWMIGGIVAAGVVGLVMFFKKEWSPVLAPLYAISEGLFIGAISAVFSELYHGIVIQAAGLTVGTLAVMLIIYRLGIIRVTEKFKMGVTGATCAVALFYLVVMIMSLFGADTSFYFGGGLLSIGLSLLIVGIAALNLVLDFDFIEKGAQNAAPAYMEWYAGFGLLVTLVWLYLEILRLLAKLQKR